MLVNIYSAKIIGIKAVPVTVEVNITLGVGIHLVGLADAAVKESLLRTVTALQALGYHVPGKKIPGNGTCLFLVNTLLWENWALTAVCGM